MALRATIFAASILLLAAFHPLHAQEPRPHQTFVLVHGAWGGGWDWRPVSDILTARGHRVFRVTLTGLGERAHLASPGIGLDTHITDVVNTILYENLRDVTLVGHSYGGMVITGVADRIPDRLAHLAYIDAYVPEDGESVLSLRAAAGRPPPEVRDGFVVPSWVKPGTEPPMDVPQSAKTFSDSIVLKNALRTKLPTTYILLVEPGKTTDSSEIFVARAKTKGWLVERMTSDHDAQRSAREELCKLLERVR